MAADRHRLTRYLRGPQGEGSFSPQQPVTCDFIPWDQLKSAGGKTSKFYCRLPDGSKIKVKYGNLEVYGEVMATRLFWALGFGADRAYPTKVTCRGCPANPWMDVHPEKSDPEFRPGTDAEGNFIFDPAIIERKLPGEKIETKEDSGWSFDELHQVKAAPKAHIDALKLLVSVAEHGDSKPANQRIICLEGGLQLAANGKVTCTQPFMFVQDLGATFGDYDRLRPKRVNYKAWKKRKVWEDSRRCVANIRGSGKGGTLSKPVISEEGRDFLLEQIDKLSPQQVEDIFKASRVELDDPSITSKMWADAFYEKVEQIREARCR